MVAVTFICTALSFAQSEDVLRPNGRPAGEQAAASSSSSKKLQWVFGIEGGINANIFNGSLEGTWENSPVNMLQNGSGFSPLVGLYVEVPLSSSISIGMRMLYDPKTFGNAVDNAEEQCYDATTDSYSLALLTSEFEESITYITLNPLIRWEPVDRFFIQIGPALQFAIDSVQSTTTKTINEDEICRFNLGTPDESRVQTTESTGSPDNSFRAGIDIGVGYRVQLGDKIDLVPRVGYQWMLTPYANDQEGFDASQADINGILPITFTNITLSSIQASLSFWFHL
jgi:hypothetical protein